MSGKSLFSQLAPLPYEHPWNYLWRQSDANSLLFPTMVFMRRRDRINSAKKIPHRDGRIYKLTDFSALVPLHEQRVIEWWRQLRSKRWDDTIDLKGLRKLICPLCLEKSSLALDVFGLRALGVCAEHACLLISVCESCSTELVWSEGSHFFCRCGFDLRTSTVRLACQKLLGHFQENHKHKEEFQSVVFCLFEENSDTNSPSSQDVKMFDVFNKVDSAISIFDDFNSFTKRALLDLFRFSWAELENCQILFFEPINSIDSCIQPHPDEESVPPLLERVTKSLISLITFRKVVVSRCAWKWLRVEFLPSSTDQVPLKVPLWAEKTNQHHHPFGTWLNSQIEKPHLQKLIEEPTSHFNLYIQVVFIDPNWIWSNDLVIPVGFET